MKRREYRIIGAYDSETTNITIEGIPSAFPILHQLGLLDGQELANITADNVTEHVNVSLFRHSLELYSALDTIIETEYPYVPVILCHNLAFDMYGLSCWLERYEVRVLAKSARKPITLTILDDSGSPRLVIWDTLIFSQQSLARMGKDCGFAKGVGEWDYDLIRTPETPLTAQETDYSKRDIYTLICWFGWWIRRNPDIDPAKLGCNVVTKTGIVRERRRVRFANLKGRGMKRNAGYYWFARCNLEAPKTDDELFTMLACTRGGFTFCSSKNASVPFNLEGTGEIVAAYDATSQHPAQLVSHMYPFRFREMPDFVLEQAFELIGLVTMSDILDNWRKPFPIAFDACFEFENLRPRKGSVFEQFGIYPLASARYKTPEQIARDETDRAAYDAHLQEQSYCDMVEDAVCAFGKVVSAKRARFYITELTAWEVWQAYEWDSVRAIHGYETGRFSRPNDIDVLSVMQFYKAKNEFKHARKLYYSGKPLDNMQTLEKLGIPRALLDEMQTRTVFENDIEAQYLSLKADLNAIFGISASNQYRRDTVLDSNGIEYIGEFGICNAPKNSTVWYQFGQRIVGWSRIAQIIAMELIRPYARTIINGDTDSVKCVCREADLQAIDKSLEKLGEAIDRGKRFVCERVRLAYADFADDLAGIGYYVPEFQAKRFCASWNKAYCMQDESGAFTFTLAGIPTKDRQAESGLFTGINSYAGELYTQGWTFEQICNTFLGYNVTFANDLLRMNARKFPEWGDIFVDDVTDYTGETLPVAEPCALALYPLAKTINNTDFKDNAINMGYALANNPDVNTDAKIITKRGIIDLEGIFDDG